MSYCNCGGCGDAQARWRCGRNNDLYHFHKYPDIRSGASYCAYTQACCRSGLLDGFQHDYGQGVPASDHALSVCLACEISVSEASSQTSVVAGSAFLYMVSLSDAGDCGFCQISYGKLPWRRSDLWHGARVAAMLCLSVRSWQKDWRNV